MSSRITFFLLALALLFSSVVPSASAQVLEESDESYIYKGFFMTAEFGAFVLALKPSDLNGSNGPNSDLIGIMSGFELGFDVGQVVSLQFTFWSTNVTGDVQAGGGVNALLLNLGATIHAVRSGRLSVYAKLGGGINLGFPGTKIGVTAHGGLGVRFFTRLRHFSVGLEATALIGIPALDNTSLSVGIGVLPTITYTF